MGSPGEDGRPHPPRGLTFGSVAEGYERHRPGYPREVVDEVLRHAGRPVLSAVEIGAGTGKATTVLAARGIDVTAVEPDADMARVPDPQVRSDALRRIQAILPDAVEIDSTVQLSMLRRI